MDIGALLKSFIYLIASSLLYPTLFLLVVLTVWILIYGGSFFAEWLERVRLRRYAPEELPGIIKGNSDQKVFPHRVNYYLETLRRILAREDAATALIIENLLQEMTLGYWKSLDRPRMVVRIGPSLGLIGTLIPMGTGLASLSQGDITKLSTDLVIAFTTTVVGLAVGITAYFFYSVRRRWIEEDVKNIELATEILASDLDVPKP